MTTITRTSTGNINVAKKNSAAGKRVVANKAKAMRVARAVAKENSELLRRLA